MKTYQCPVIEWIWKNKFTEKVRDKKEANKYMYNRTKFRLNNS